MAAVTAHRHSRRSLALALALGCGACSGVSPSRSARRDTSPTVATEPDPSLGATSEPDPAAVPNAVDGGAEPSLERCSPGPGATGSPQTVGEVVTLINSLPMPVTLPCFLQSLERPLRVVATYNVISAQPANGRNNPRLFLMGDGISMSVVPTGDGSHLLEIGELTSNTRSIKAEVEFPISEPLAQRAPFERIQRAPGGTVCYVCHHDEAAADYPLDGAFESIAYRPVAGTEVDLAYLAAQYTSCDPQAEPDRCAFFAALFDQGSVTPGAFPEEMPTFE